MDSHDSIWLTGAGTGIGAALARKWLREGRRVVLSGRRREPLDAVLESLPAEARGRGMVVPCDVSVPGSVAEAYASLRRDVGVPAMVVANAGTHQHMSPGEMTFESCRAIIDVNLYGAIATLTAALPDFLARGSGTLVGVASLAGYRGLPFAAAYGASKAGLINFLESLRFNVEPAGLRVVVVNPGFVKTPLTDRNPFSMPFLMGPDEAADAIARGLERGRREIHFPPALSWVMKTLRVLPFPLYHAWIRRQTMSAKGEAASPVSRGT